MDIVSFISHQQIESGPIEEEETNAEDEGNAPMDTEGNGTFRKALDNEPYCSAHGSQDSSEWLKSREQQSSQQALNLTPQAFLSLGRKCVASIRV
ncbi:hypothetical protein P7K49_027946 [Saguinus oedipus]|uniref:Uncharacterized protein n=1 Tax=Saguinus oedipus TaxID=9490 RepID=A0ABQ9UC56_SAGOE|nr:hypothetical protein P7K49_027946 [Saguinus oedipus]